MSIRVLGYNPDGTRIVVDDGPATGRMHHRLASFSQRGIGGSLVTGDPGAADRQRAAQREHMARKRAAKP